MNSLNSLEINSLECDFCQEVISGEIIKPCRCDKYYHNTCIQHITNISDNPLVFQKCEKCNCDYKTKYKNTYSKYIYKYFSYHSRYLYYNYTGFGLISLIINLIINSDINNVVYGITIGCLCYTSLICTSIALVFTLYDLNDKRIAYILSGFSLLLSIINLSYQEHWLEGASLALSGVLLVKTKKNLFVLSSYYPYLIIKNYYKHSKLEAII